jgi:glycosyltransferase involved in cell wall biosynthesis
MSKISTVIIARNEEKMIEDALDSVSFCDEIIVIDNNSTDNTKKIAEKKNAKVYDVNSNDFSFLRNYGLEKSSSEWILYLDSDERVSEQLQSSIKKVVSNGSEYSAFFLKRKNYYFGKNEWPQIEKLERLFKKQNLKKWKGQLHESPIIEGSIGELDGYIFHFTHRDLDSMLNKTIEWSSTEALLRYNSGHPQMTWWRFPRVMITAFLSSYIKQQGFRAGAVGLMESVYQAFSIFITYAKLWELQHNAKLKNEKT